MTVVVILTAFVTTEWYVALCNRTVTPEPVPVPQVRNQPDDGWCTG